MYYTKPYKIMVLYFLVVILNTIKLCSPNGEIVSYILPKNCSEREYYVPGVMSCILCDDNQRSSFDRLHCICEKNSRIINRGLEVTSCEPCPSNMVVTMNQLHCLKITNVTCGSMEIELETDVNGSPSASRSCVRCSPGTSPSADRARCVPCPVAGCTCPSTTHELLLDGSLCVARANMSAWPDDRDAHLVAYDLIGAEAESEYLKKHLRPLLYKCVKMKHRTSCEALGNLCAVQMYNDERKVGACKVFKDYRRIPTSSDADRLPLPWIYYGEGDASIVLNRKKITAKYSIRPDEHVRITRLVVRS